MVPIDICTRKSSGKNFKDSGKFFPVSYIFYTCIWKDLSNFWKEFAPRIKGFFKWFIKGIIKAIFFGDGKSNWNKQTGFQPTESNQDWISMPFQKNGFHGAPNNPVRLLMWSFPGFPVHGNKNDARADRNDRYPTARYKSAPLKLPIFHSAHPPSDPSIKEILIEKETITKNSAPKIQRKKAS